jgi:hypothetical protein
LGTLEDEEKMKTWHCLVATLQWGFSYMGEVIEAFQEKIDNLYINLSVKDGVEEITHEIHMLGSSHIKYYMTQLHNLNFGESLKTNKIFNILSAERPRNPGIRKILFKFHSKSLTVSITLPIR